MKIDQSEKRIINTKIVVAEKNCWDCDYIFNNGLCEIFDRQVNKFRTHKSKPLAVCLKSTIK